MISAIFYITILAGLTHLTYYLVLFSPLNKYNSKTNENQNDSVSLIICYKNDKENVLKNLPSWQSQKYSDFEILLMDDFSNVDQKVNLQSESKIKLFDVKLDKKGKKQALLEGISHAKNSLLLLTDADCCPVSDKWMNSMVSQLENKDIVLGYGPLKKAGGFVNLFARYETFLTALQYFSYAINKMTYMGVGRNLLYKKSIIPESNVFDADIASGDDDLLIQKIATKDNVAINLDPNSFVYSSSPTSIKDFINQKSRHSSTSLHYKPTHKLLLGVFAASQIIFWVGIILILLTKVFSLKYVLILLLIKWGVEMLVVKNIMVKLNEKDLFIWYPILDFITFLYYILLTPILFFTNNHNTWK